MKEHKLVIDVEATCWDNAPHNRHEMEIIEIGAVLLDEDDNIKDQFQSFIKPVRNPVLSYFCKQLTSITQEDVDKAPTFKEAMTLMQFRMLEGREPQPLFCSWGDYDKKQFLNDCGYHKHEYPFGIRHLNVKQLFAKVLRCQTCGIGHALMTLKLNFEGTQHRGIDDAKNIARILKIINQKGS
jgi:inhibitor of KinA sporulation pathway (predicted exonuclease)